MKVIKGGVTGVHGKQISNEYQRPPPHLCLYKTIAHLMGLSDDFDGGRIKERRVIDGPVTCSHKKPWISLIKPHLTQS